MLKKNLIPAVSVVIILLAVSAGCQSHAKKAQAAQLRWQKATANAKMPLARGLFEEDKFDDAQQVLSEILQADPQIAEAHLLMGKLHLSRAGLDQAQNSLRFAVELDQNLDQAWYWLGQIAQYKQEPEQALEYYHKAMSLKPANVEYILTVVKTHTANDNWDAGLELLEEKAILLSGNTELKVATADVCLRLGNSKKAISLYQQALLLDPEDLEIIESLGYNCIMASRWAEAAEMFEKLAAKSQGDKKKTCLQLLAMCSMNAKDYGRAFSYYDQLSVECRDDAELWLQMGLAALGANAPNRAFACSQRSLALRPAWSDAIVLQGCAQYFNNDYGAAIRTFKKATSNNENAGFAWLMTGRCYQQLGKEQQAQKAFENAEQMNPESKLLTLLTKPKG